MIWCTCSVCVYACGKTDCIKSTCFKGIFDRVRMENLPIGTSVNYFTSNLFADARQLYINCSHILLVYNSVKIFFQQPIPHQRCSYKLPIQQDHDNCISLGAIHYQVIMAGSAIYLSQPLARFSVPNDSQLATNCLLPLGIFT